MLALLQMSGVNGMLIGFMVITIILITTSLALSALAWREYSNKNTTRAKQYTMWSTLASGISIVLVVVVIVAYGYVVRRDIAKGVAEGLHATAQHLSTYSQYPPPGTASVVQHV